MLAQSLFSQKSFWNVVFKKIRRMGEQKWFYLLTILSYFIFIFLYIIFYFRFLICYV